jgi:hypothetical protein
MLARVQRTEKNQRFEEFIHRNKTRMFIVYGLTFSLIIGLVFWNSPVGEILGGFISATIFSNVVISVYSKLNSPQV